MIFMLVMIKFWHISISNTEVVVKVCCFHHVFLFVPLILLCLFINTLYTMCSVSTIQNYNDCTLYLYGI